jgi:glycosyltransferase involved in cell wall biosynthesis
VFAAPLRFAAGVQNKVLEAMASGRPVVTTTLVNDGIGANPGRDLIVVDDPEAMVSHIANLFQQAQLRREMGAAARIFVEQNFSWQFAVQRMGAIEGFLKQ